MASDTPDNDVRSQASLDDERLEARRKAIMEHRAPRKGKSGSAPTGNPDWLKRKNAAKPQAATEPEKPARKRKPKAPEVKPPKGSDESWKLAIEYVLNQQAKE